MPTRRALIIGIGAYPHFPNDQLLGAVADARLFAATLQERFGFPEAELSLLLDEAATRESLVAALDGLAERAEPGDAVVLYYSGHGSQRLERAPEGEEADRYEEVLVPYDSGHRAPAENRDLSDDELGAWVRRVRARTENLTLIFDCCHSGSLDRQRSARQVPMDRRRRPPSGRPRTTRGGSGWLPLERGYTLLAACRDGEISSELRTPAGVHGALTWHLVQALTAPGAAGQSWQALFEPVAARVNADFLCQHPQLEGERERLPFGVERAPLPGVGVSARAGEELWLEAGAILGARVGARWALIDPAQGPASKAEARAEVELVEVQALRSRARLLGEAPRETDQLRALPRDPAQVTPLTLSVVPGAPQPTVEALAARLGSDGLVRLGEDGDHQLVWVSARAEVRDKTPCAELGPLDEDVWAVLCREEHALPPVRAGELDRLAENLRALARARRLLSLRNEDPWSELQDRVSLRLLAYDADGALLPLEPDPASGLPTLREGEPFSLEVHNGASREVYAALVDVGLLGSVSVFWRRGPLPPGGREIVDRERRLRLGFPAGYEAMPGSGGAPRREGLERLILVVGTRPMELGGLAQAGARDVAGLDRLDEDWGACIRTIRLVRRGSA